MYLRNKMMKEEHGISNCPSCGKNYRIPVEFSGRKIACKKCGEKFTLHLIGKGQKEKTGKTESFEKKDVEHISQDDAYLVIGKLAVKYKFVSIEQVK